MATRAQRYEGVLAVGRHLLIYGAAPGPSTALRRGRFIERGEPLGVRLQLHFEDVTKALDVAKSCSQLDGITHSLAELAAFCEVLDDSITQVQLAERTCHDDLRTRSARKRGTRKGARGEAIKLLLLPVSPFKAGRCKCIAHPELPTSR
jgi:hypothetical protein